MGDDADGGPVVLAGRVARRDRRLGVVATHDRSQPGEDLDGGVGADVLVGVDDAGGAALAHRHRHDLVGEPARVARRRGPAMAADGELVLLGARDAVVAAQVLGRLDHPAGHREVGAARGDPPAGQPVVQQHTGPAAHTPAHGGRVERRARHRLGPAREHDVRYPAPHLHRRVEDGLQARAAAAVDLQPGGGHREARVQRDDPADRGRLHRRVAVPEQDVVDGVGRDAGALDDRADDRRRQLVGRDVAQRPPEPADRGTQRLADDGVTHRFLPPSHWRRCRRDVPWRLDSYVWSCAQTYWRVSHSATSAGRSEPSISTVTLVVSCTAPPFASVTSRRSTTPRTLLPTGTGEVKRTLLSP